MSRSDQRLRNDFKDKEYAHAYVNEFLNTQIATQIRVLREQRDLKQKELAEMVDMKQSRISVLEDVYNEMWSISTLKRLAEAFDVTLNVSFETFSTRITDMQNFSRETLKRLPRTLDLAQRSEVELDKKASSNVFELPHIAIEGSSTDQISTKTPMAESNSEIEYAA